MPQVAFRRLAAADLPLLFTWLARPHVKKWYAPEPSSFMEVAAKYGPRTEEASIVKAFMIQVDGADAGYIQTYPIDRFPEYLRSLEAEGEKGIMGMDLFLGDPWRAGHGLGAFVIRRFLAEHLLSDPEVLACVAGPNEGNAASIRAFEKAGFRRWKVVPNERGEKECVLRRDRDTGSYRITPIDLKDAQTCIRLRHDMYMASLGTQEGLEEEMGADNALYLEQLRARIEQLPEGNTHLWRDDEIVGQLEMRLIEDEPDVGYLSLIHIVPEWRGHGLGKRLHAHAMQVSRGLGKRLMRLSVSRRNAPATLFYRRLGWVVVGTRAGRETKVVMEVPVR